jgi:hypothetical protein
MKLPIDIGIMMRCVDLFWQFCFFLSFFHWQWDAWWTSANYFHEKHEDLIKFQRNLKVGVWSTQVITFMWKTVRQAEKSKPMRIYLRMMSRAACPGDPFFSRCFFLSMISRSFSQFWRLFYIGASHYLFTDLGFWARCVLCLQDLAVLPDDANERTRIINVPLQYLAQRQRISIRLA